MLAAGNTGTAAQEGHGASPPGDTPNATGRVPVTCSGRPSLGGGLAWVISTGAFQFQLLSDAARRILECKPRAVRKPETAP